jgi:hypothetical protein
MAESAVVEQGLGIGFGVFQQLGGPIEQHLVGGIDRGDHGLGWSAGGDCSVLPLPDLQQIDLQTRKEGGCVEASGGIDALRVAAASGGV